MIDSIKITSLTNIGANLSYTSIFPVVNITGTPITNKANLQIIGNYILSQAGGANMVQAAQANLAQAVVNSAQPNITSVGTLISLAVTGNANVSGLTSLTTLNVATAANLGAVGNIVITGGTVGQKLTTNGNGGLSWTNDADSSYSNSNVAAYLPTYTGNIGAGNINVTGLTSLAVLTVSTTANLGAVDNITITGGSNGQVLTTNGNGVLSWKNDANSSYGNSNVVSLLSAFGSNTITTTGNVSVGNIIGNGQALTNIAGANVSGFVPNANVANTAFAVAAANVSGLGNIATINLTGSNANVLYGNGVFAAVAGGNANTGNVTFSDQIVIGTGSNDGSGGLYLAPGNNSIANSALQYLRVRGGDVVTHIHLDTGNNAFYDQYFGNDAKYVKLEAGDAGNVVIGTDDANGNQYSWSFTSDGNLILAGGDSVIQSIANSSLDPNNANVSTMVFTPDQNYTSQSLVIDPTGPSHIHLRAPSANIDEPDANIFLGGEDSSFEVGYYNGAAPNLFVHSGGNTWTFDTTGILVFPRDTGPNTTDPILNIIGGANPTITSTDASLAGPANLGISALTTTFTGFTGDAIKIYPDDGEISSTANLQIWANSGGNTEYSWTFGDDGNLYLPDTTSVLANVSIRLEANDTGNITGLSVIGDSHANLYAHGNVTIVSDSSSNTTPTWTFGTNGNLTLPLGSIVYETNIPDQSLSGSAIALKPIGGTTANQQLLIYPTAADGDHIHMTSGNLYTTELFLGSDNLYVKLANTGNVVINSNDGNSNTAMWTFGTNGSLTLPIGVSIDYNGNVQYPKIIADSGKLFSVQGQGNTGSAALAWTIDPNAASQYAAVAVTRAGDDLAKVVLTAQANSGDSANAKTWTFNEAGNLTLPGNTFAVNYANGTQVSLGGGNVTWAQLDDKDGNSGPTIIALGQNAGLDGQGNAAIAIGKNAGQGGQGASSITIGEDAGGNTTQGANSVAIGRSAGFDAQGTNSIAIGANAGITNQGNNSIILNATGANLNQTTANTFTVAPVRNDTSNIAEVMFYNTTSKEVTYGNTISVAGNANVGNLNTTTAIITTGNITTINSGLLQNGNSNITLTANGNVSIQAAGSDVELVVTSTGANVTGTLNVTGNITGGNVVSATTFKSAVVAFSALPAATTPGLRAFISDANLVPAGNFGVAVSGGGGNYVPVFSDGANWCIG